MSFLPPGQKPVDAMVWVRHGFLDLAVVRFQPRHISAILLQHRRYEIEKRLRVPALWVQRIEKRACEVGVAIKTIADDGAKPKVRPMIGNGQRPAQSDRIVSCTNSAVRDRCAMPLC